MINKSYKSKLMMDEETSSKPTNTKPQKADVPVQILTLLDDLAQAYSTTLTPHLSALHQHVVDTASVYAHPFVMRWTRGMTDDLTAVLHGARVGLIVLNTLLLAADCTTAAAVLLVTVLSTVHLLPLIRKNAEKWGRNIVGATTGGAWHVVEKNDPSAEEDRVGGGRVSDPAPLESYEMVPGNRKSLSEPDWLTLRRKEVSDDFLTLVLNKLVLVMYWVALLPHATIPSQSMFVVLTLVAAHVACVVAHIHDFYTMALVQQEQPLLFILSLGSAILTVFPTSDLVVLASLPLVYVSTRHICRHDAVYVALAHDLLLPPQHHLPFRSMVWANDADALLNSDVLEQHRCGAVLVSEHQAFCVELGLVENKQVWVVDQQGGVRLYLG